MILSHKHRFIFLHCRKTAGSSICVSLARVLGPDDLQLSGLQESFEAGIATPARVLREAKDELKSGGGSLKDRLALEGLLGGARQNKAMIRLIKAHYEPRLGARPQHAHASELRACFPEEWERYAKFCVVRNPWDKTVSDYFWRTKGRSDPPSFERFVHALRDGDELGGMVLPEYHDNWPLYTIDDRIVADRVVRFETLAEDLKDTCAALDIPFDGWLPRAKGSYRPKSGKTGDTRSLYTPELQRIVGTLYEKEIEAFGYTF
ncbi:sulfotransferase family 2 domain-containing protein [Salipiger sp. H15]|uniref:Sulfotransferase family 2 domain-containing protein n=1 Tax=Alloyangia sp. H15 TaxID=3029062 RepID=A0AAU8ANK7_9RHOB